VPTEVLTEWEKRMQQDAVNPMSIKKRLATDIVTQLYDADKAQAAGDHFARVIQRRELPDKITEFKMAGRELRDVLVDSGMCKSKGEATRLINQGAIEINNDEADTPTAVVVAGSVIKIGKRRFIKIID